MNPENFNNHRPETPENISRVNWAAKRELERVLDSPISQLLELRQQDFDINSVEDSESSKDIDKKLLDLMEEKRQLGIDFNNQELRFLYELDSPIEEELVGDYLQINPKINEFKSGQLAKHQHQLRPEIGDNVELMDEERVRSIIEQSSIEQLTRRYDPKILINKMESQEVIDNIDQLKAAGADTNDIIRRLHSSVIIANHLDKLISLGGDVELITKRLTSDLIAAKINDLNRAGGDIDPNQLVEKMFSQHIKWYFEELKESGVDINRLIARLDSVDADDLLQDSLRSGGSPQLLASRLGAEKTALRLGTFREEGIDSIDVNRLLQNISPEVLKRTLGEIVNYARQFNQKLDLESVVKNYDYYSDLQDDRQLLLDGGADQGLIDSQLAKLKQQEEVELAKQKDRRIQVGVNVKKLLDGEISLDEMKNLNDKLN